MQMGELQKQVFFKCNSTIITPFVNLLQNDYGVYSSRSFGFFFCKHIEIFHIPRGVRET
jgi:hypothetical protein